MNSPRSSPTMPQYRASLRGRDKRPVFFLPRLRGRCRQAEGACAQARMTCETMQRPISQDTSARTSRGRRRCCGHDCDESRWKVSAFGASIPSALTSPTLHALSASLWWKLTAPRMAPTPKGRPMPAALLGSTMKAGACFGRQILKFTRILKASWRPSAQLFWKLVRQAPFDPHSRATSPAHGGRETPSLAHSGSLAKVAIT